MSELLNSLTALMVAKQDYDKALASCDHETEYYCCYLEREDYTKAEARFSTALTAVIDTRIHNSKQSGS